MNNALLLLGDNVIISLTDNTARARLANNVFGPTRDAVLRAHPWNCAVTRANLALLSTAPISGWQAQFTLPSDPYCLRVLAINDDEESGDNGTVFKIEGRKLLANTTVAKIRFISRITDANQYDSMLYDAFIFRLASKMAYPVTGSLTVSQEMWTLYEGVIKEARTVDGQEGSPDLRSVNTLLDMR